MWFSASDIDLCGYRIRMGVSFEEATSSLNSKEVLALINYYSSKSFIVIPNLEKKQVNVILAENISSSDMVEAYVRSVLAVYSFEYENEVSFGYFFYSDKFRQTFYYN